MKHLILFALVFCTVHVVSQQNVGIGTTSPQSSSILDLSSTTQGFLVPRMTGEQRAAIASPANGLMVYQTNFSITHGAIGLYMYAGSWKRMARNEDIPTPTWTVSGNDQYNALSGGVGIGGTTPNASAILDLTSTTKGFLIPRMTGVQRVGIQSPSIGLMVYQTNLDIINGSPGLYVHNGTSWKRMARAEELTGGTSSWTVVGDDQYSNVDGRVGIGTMAPRSKLHVTGGTFANYTTHNGFVQLGDSSGLNLVLGHYEILARSNGAAAPLYLQQEGGAVRIGNSGSTADTRLHITDGGESSLTTHGYLLLGLTTSGNLVLDPNEIQARSNGAATTLRLQQDGGALLVQGGALTVASDGNVGIGDLTPDQKLHVAGNGLFDGTNPTIHLRNAGVDKGFVQLSGDNLRVGTHASNTLGNFVIRTNNNDRVFVDPNGNMGIGDDTPDARLDVVGSMHLTFNGEALRVDGSNPLVQFYHNGVAKSFLWQDGNDLQIGTSTGNNTGQVRLTGDQIYMTADEVAINVGGAGPAPGYSLSVGGEIICEELRVELQGNGPWPDYVFADDYKLRSLDELKAFIGANKHLPNIPAAAQVEAEGFDVGDMNRRLLEKVEELTLYIIDQQETIRHLDSRVKQLESQNRKY